VPDQLGLISGQLRLDRGSELAFTGHSLAAGTDRRYAL
jgi:hypothetical protein